MSTNATIQSRLAQTPQWVLDLLRKQVVLSARLEVLACKQRGMVARDDTEPLAAVLAARQEVTEALSRLGEALAPVRRDWADFRTRLSPEQCRDADELWRRISGHLSRVQRGDEEDARLLTARKQLVRDMLKGTHVTKLALSAYRVPMRRAARVNYVDEAS